MLAFTKMLAERQKSMADASLTYVGLQPDSINADRAAASAVVKRS